MRLILKAGVAPSADEAASDAARATERSAALIAAALALPGILPAPAHAQTAPDEGVVALRYLDYRDWQPGARRMTVRNPSLYALVPLGSSFAVEGSVIYDAMSGASPLYHDTLSGASGLGVTDYRTAGDVRVWKYIDGNALAFGVAGSYERDYKSRAASFEWRITERAVAGLKLEGVKGEDADLVRLQIYTRRWSQAISDPVQQPPAPLRMTETRLLN